MEETRKVKNMIQIEFTNETGESRVFKRNKIFLQDQVIVLENLAKLEETRKLNSKLQKELEESVEHMQEVDLENDESTEQIEQYTAKLREMDVAIQKAHLEMIYVYAEMMIKIFNEEFTTDEFLQGMGTDFQIVCDNIISEILGGPSDSEKK